MADALTNNPPRRGRRPADHSAQLAELRAVGLFDLAAAHALGLSPATVYRLVATGALSRVGENLFIHAGADIDPQAVEFTVACKLLGPHAAIGGLSALLYYQLTDSGSTDRLWLVVPPERKTRRSMYRLIRTTTPIDLEVETHAPGFRIVTLERAIVEAFRFASKFGLETGFTAAKMAFGDGRTTAGDLLHVARRLGLEQFVLRHWEALLALEGARS